MGLTLQKLEQTRSGNNPISWVAILVFTLLCCQSAFSLSPNSVSITNKSGPRFILDSNNPCNGGPRASYVAYWVCNTSGGTLNNLTATLSGLASGFALSGGQPASQSIGTLAAGECAELFWYVSYPCTFNTQTNVVITVADANPGTNSKTDVIFTRGSLSATAGGQLISITVGPGLILGSTTHFDVVYEFGNIPKNGAAYFQPAGNSNYDAGCMKLIGSEVISSDIPATIPVGITNVLYHIAPQATGGGTYRVTVRFLFEVACNSINTTLKPFAGGNSGSQLKHTSNYGTIVVDVPDDFPPPDPCLIGTPDGFASQKIGTGIGLEGNTDDWSASWGDYNNDGYPDLFVTTYDPKQPNTLYHNDGDGTFTKVNTPPFSTDLASSVSASWGDYDNDGDLDLYVGNNIGFTNFLYRNEGGGSFTKILNDPIVTDEGYSHGVSWADYDNDGFLDMFVAVYWETSFNLLYHNNGDGTFSQVTNHPIANEASRSVSGAWGDYDSDGLLDLFVANTGGQNNSLYHNLGGGEFERIATGSIVNDGGSSVGASWGDYNNDGHLDLVVANAGNEPNFLYKNNGNSIFSRITTGSIVTDLGHHHGSAWADWDNDGDLDLFVARDGHDNALYRNDGGDVFTSIQNEITSGGGLSFGSAWGDYDRDGDLDLFVANREDEANFFYQNTKGTCNNWTAIKLIGTNSNKSAIGARVTLTAIIGGQSVTQIREVSGQSGGGTGGQNELTLHLGLGDATSISSIIIEWPSGFQQTVFNQPINQFLQFTETDGAEICGRVYHDANGNCQQDVGELGTPDTKIVLSPGGITAFTDDNGDYSVFVKTGMYTLQEQPSSVWSPNCPNAQGTRTVNATVLGNQYCGNNFGNTALVALPDLFTEIVTTTHRIGENNLMLIHYKNIGTVTADDVTLDASLPAEITLLLSSLPYAAAKSQATTLTFSLGSLPPNANGTIYLSYTIDVGTPIGTPVIVEAVITNGQAEITVVNNNSMDISMAVAAYDPNDIAVSPTRFVKRSEWLQYKIRFQNVGNFAASQVRVEDELPDGLDLNTLELGSASHTYKFQMEGRKLVWTFPNINLPDSTLNEPASHGYLLFRIKPSATLALGEKLPNRAAIFFDNLQPVLTNRVENVLTDGIEKETKAPARPLLLYPNPTSGKLIVQPLELEMEPDAFFVTITVYDHFGRQIIETANLASQRQELALDNVPTGSYQVKAVDNKGRAYIGKVVVGH